MNFQCRACGQGPTNKSALTNGTDFDLYKLEVPHMSLLKGSFCYANVFVQQNPFYRPNLTYHLSVCEIAQSLASFEGLLKVQRCIVDGLDEDSSQPQAPPAGGKVLTKLLVPATQAGSLIGKQGATVKSIQEAANCIVRVLGQVDLPVFALQDDRVVEVVGEAVDVHKTIEMQASNAPMEHFPIIQPQPWGPPLGFPPNGGDGHGGFGANMEHMPPSRQLDNYYPLDEMTPPPDNKPHQEISVYGREPPVGSHASSNAHSAPSIITQERNSCLYQ